MQTPPLIHALKPNVASLGYGLFLAINAASVWGGSFPFLPMDFQTSEVLSWFFLAQSVVFTLSFFASAVGTYFFPSQTRRFMVKVVVAPYLLGWCLLIGAIYFPAAALPLASTGGGLLGLGSAGFYMLWQRLFASQDAPVGTQSLIAGTAWAAVLYFALYLIPVAVTAYLIPLVFLPLFGLAVVLKSRTIDLNQPMFEDNPREHPRTYRHVISLIWRPALAIGALGFCTGIMRSLAVVDPSVGSLVNILSMAATLIAAVAFLAAWTVKNLRFNVSSAYRIFFPLVTTAFLLLPIAGSEYARMLAAVLYALWSVAIMLMMMQCAQVSRDGGINPVFIYGVFGGMVYALHDVGFIGGSFVEALAVGGIPSVVLVTVVAIYLLGLMYFIGQGGFRSAMASGGADEIELLALRRKARSVRTGENAQVAGGRDALADAGASGGPAGAAGAAAGTAVGGGTSTEAANPTDAASPMRAARLAESTDNPEGEGIAAHGLQPERIAAADNRETSTDDALDAHSLPNPRGLRDSRKTRDAHTRKKRDILSMPDSSGEGEAYRDRLSKQMAVVREHYGLSARETEVAELIARGNSVARIAETLVVSENTIRTHSKRIYTKLDIHKRQELIELVESFDPGER